MSQDFLIYFQIVVYQIKIFKKSAECLVFSRLKICQTIWIKCITFCRKSERNNQMEVRKSTTNQSLKMQKSRIESMKWLLDYENTTEEYSEEMLKKQIDDLCFKSFCHLIVIIHYLKELPVEISDCINQILNKKSDTRLIKKLYFEYLNYYKTNDEFKGYETLILLQRSRDALKFFPSIEKEQFEFNVDKICKILTEIKRVQLSLVFNILYNEANLFVKRDFIHNVPQLINWIRENNIKPIENLTNDECELIAAFIYGHTLEESINKLNFSSFVDDVKSLENIANNLPKKFGVQNMTQVLFRILLLKPQIWDITQHNELVRNIKGVCNEN